jgi:DNA modification methylase
MKLLEIIKGDCRETLKNIPDDSVQCCITSPPYYNLRDYRHPQQIGRERTVDDYVGVVVEIFREVRRILKPSGTLWLNLADTYQDKRLLGIPWRVALEMQEPEARCIYCEQSELVKEWTPGESINSLGCPYCGRFQSPEITPGWILRQEVIWQKPNAMPEAVSDRCSRDHETIFLFSKSPTYLFKSMKEPVKSTRAASRKAKRTGVGKAGGHRSGSAYDGTETMRTRRTVWSVPVSQCRDAHFAVFPSALIRPCVESCTNPGDLVLDPFGGTGTTARVALESGRRAILLELNDDYIELATRNTVVTLSLDLTK